MILVKRFKNSTLFFFGALAIAIQGTMQMIYRHLGRSTDPIDFILGILLGIGIALMLLVAWRTGRERHA